ncbi:MAG: oxidoreductase [Archangium gephyra]|uniref:Oxidoreductase n=1 Tax=Archangium gephyra TaxID=48 RepID=A0A2W5W2R4_9BACT|nr:MAG: oxidoreductase [Archangium gephyra]
MGGYNAGSVNRDRVVQIVAPGRVELVDVDVPALNDGEVLVRTEVSALSAGTERLVSNGAVDASFAAQNRPGYCSVGVVEAGEPSLLGARVFAFHPHQSRFVARAADVIRLPEGMSAEVATLLANTETAVSLVMDAAPVLGEVSAVVGLGIVGQLVLAIASRLQSGPVHGVDLRADRIEVARRVSPSALFTTASDVDLLYEVSGSTKALEAAFGLVRREGRIVAGSWYDGAVTLGARAHRNRNTVKFSQVSTIDSSLSGRFDKRRRMSVALDWLSKIPASELITHRIPFAEAPRAWELLARPPQGCLQILLTHGY